MKISSCLQHADLVAIFQLWRTAHPGNRRENISRVDRSAASLHRKRRKQPTQTLTGGRLGPSTTNQMAISARLGRIDLGFEPRNGQRQVLGQYRSELKCY